ncbi:phosphotransferase enzyme family protein [Promicromonospora soli]|nr:phosphotransferase [Promicromonospora soli]
MDAQALVRLLHLHWGLSSATISPLGGGMNSETWLVQAGDRSYVAKRVAASDVAQLAAGSAVAERLALAGLTTGRPVRTTRGSLVVPGERLALLGYVPGRELEGTTREEQRQIGRTLAEVHAASTLVSDTTGRFFDWLSPAAPGVSAHPWLPPAIEAARAAADHLAVTWSVLHTDPAPEAFRHDDATGTTGLIDWTGACRGPVLYDVASAVMYLGGPRHATAFLDAYSAASPLDPAELLHLDTFRRFRWAVQAAYFARRLSTNDLTGISHQGDNERGLDDARRGLGELSRAER